MYMQSRYNLNRKFLNVQYFMLWMGFFLVKDYASELGNTFMAKPIWFGFDKEVLTSFQEYFVALGVSTVLKAVHIHIK